MGFNHSSRPSQSHSQPIAAAVTSEASSRASTISGLPGKATAVAVSTTGFTAGADSRNANAAAGVTPRPIRLLATGTDAHSHPGSTTPAIPATGTASAARFGSSRLKTRAGTNASIAPDRAVPSSRNGSACTVTARHTVRHACIAGWSNDRPTSTSSTPGTTAAPSSNSGQCRGSAPAGRACAARTPSAAAADGRMSVSCIPP